MDRKTVQLQIRLTPAEKAELRRRARQAGQDMSAYVVSRALPPARSRFETLVGRLRHEEGRTFVLAELNDLLTELPDGELREAVATAPLDTLSPYLQNYVAAMVEHTVHHRGLPPPAWVRAVEPLETPHFATDLESLRLHLLKTSPVAFKRRNIFIDSTVGDRV